MLDVLHWLYASWKKNKEGLNKQGRTIKRKKIGIVTLVGNDVFVTKNLPPPIKKKKKKKDEEKEEEKMLVVLLLFVTWTCWINQTQNWPYL